VIEDVENGRIDMVVGTHALISKQLSFKNLGLYIIDEEQRFGVFQKEKLKQNREDVDVLSLSATPIPRTLSLSVAGLQDISVIQSPPIGRLAVKNYVGYYSKEIILSALLPELEREGLIYIVYNNIDKIYSFRNELQSWLPAASFAVIHAKMPAESVEKTLMDFIAKKFRILISTTIIENGIDIPEVNTLIVIDADRFGLTQLYQLRGRIGRSSRQAYAYFLIRSSEISEKARSRLTAIREFADLGSGYRLAEFDLKLRGMGSLLGNRQHGHIEALGFDYYLELLNRTVRDLKGQSDTAWEGKINIHFPYTIDTSYISDTSVRLQYYKKILETRSTGELLDLRNELADRFGPAPEGLGRVFLVSMVRMIARRCLFQEVDLFERRMEVKPSDGPRPLPPACRKFVDRLSDGADGSGVRTLEWDQLDEFFALCGEFEDDRELAAFNP
jgi:transcription-repair coupling factor (superfamily II helicase)